MFTLFGDIDTQCCGLLSVFGIFFLFSVGHMFATEPMFTDPEVWHDGHGDDASFNCYMGGVIYICTLVVSAQGRGISFCSSWAPSL